MENQGNVAVSDSSLMLPKQHEWKKGSNGVDKCFIGTGVQVFILTSLRNCKDIWNAHIHMCECVKIKLYNDGCNLCCLL